VKIVKFLSFCSLFLIGCATAPKPVFNEAMTADELQIRLMQTVRSLKDFYAEGSITVNTPTMNQSVGFDLVTRGKDSVKLSFYGPFGITVGTALFHQQEFTAYNALNNTVYRGSPEKQMRMLPFIKDVPFELLISSLQGIHPLRLTSPLDSVEVKAEHSYSFTITNEDASFDKFLFDEDFFRITRCIRKDKNGTVLWSVRYWYKRNGDSSVVPEQVEVNIPSKESTLVLEYGSVSYDSVQSPLTISFPDDAEIITIE